MQKLTTEEVADYLKEARIDKTIDAGFAFIHIGKNALGISFVLVNDMFENSALIESM